MRRYEEIKSAIPYYIKQEVSRRLGHGILFWDLVAVVRYEIRCDPDVGRKIDERSLHPVKFLGMRVRGYGFHPLS